MCESFSFTTAFDVLCRQFKLDTTSPSALLSARKLPTQGISVIIEQGGARKLEAHRWGLVPFWAKEAVCADAEAVANTRLYGKLLDRQRCLIPCSGFTSLRPTAGRKPAVRASFASADGSAMAAAGIYERWTDSRGVEWNTCAVLMTRANRLVFPYDDRMPALLGTEQDRSAWLSAAFNGQTDFLLSLLRVCDPGRMRLTEAARSRGLLKRKASGIGN